MKYLFLILLIHPLWSQIKWTRTDNLPVEIQFQKDQEIILNTMFPNEENLKPIMAKLSPNDSIEVEAKNQLLKKLILLISFAELAYSTQDNNYKNLIPWPFPIASVLCHGQRTIFRFEGDINVPLEYLGGGKGLPAFKERIAASHDVDLDKEGNPIEVKLKGLLGSAENITAGLSGNHLGSSIPLGGIGNINNQGFMIGPDGYSLDKSQNIIPKTQHGHIYFRKDQFNNKFGTLLFGMENSGPGKENMWGAKHTAASASADQTKGISPCGGKKWGAMGIPNAPAEYGGKQFHLSPNSLKEISQRIDKILKLTPDKQKEIFEKVLMMNAVEAKNYLNTI